MTGVTTGWACLGGILDAEEIETFVILISAACHWGEIIRSAAGKTRRRTRFGRWIAAATAPLGTPPAALCSVARLPIPCRRSGTASLTGSLAGGRRPATSFPPITAATPPPGPPCGITRFSAFTAWSGGSTLFFGGPGRGRSTISTRERFVVVQVVHRPVAGP
jgi:hypothetical protein